MTQRLLAFRARVLDPAYRAIAERLHARGAKAQVVQAGRASGDEVLDELASLMHPTMPPLWTLPTLRAQHGDAALVGVHFVGPILVASQAVARGEHPHAGKVLYTVLHRVGEGDSIAVAPSVMYFMRYDRELHRFHGRFRDDAPLLDAELATPDDLVRHFDDAWTSFRAFAHLPESPTGTQPPARRHRVHDLRMADGSRSFASLPASHDVTALRPHLERLVGLRVDKITDGVVEVWLDFRYRGHAFTAHDVDGEWEFFVTDPECPTRVLEDLVDHAAKLLDP